MPDAIAALTDKEKEALRLLLAGHDAKSSAAELDISVHTVNDRLRNARRKLGVSSSREAARILGDAEGTIPQRDAHRPLGMAAGTARTDNADLDTTRHPAASRTVWLAGGMLIMSIVIAVAAVALVSSGSDPASEAVAASEAAAEDAAVDAESLPRAERFLARIDEGDWQASWDAAGPYFQSQLSAAEWVDTVASAREPLGNVQSRVLRTVSTPPQTPDGEYEVLQFETHFEGRDPFVAEIVILREGEAGWEVAGYFIR